MKILLVEDEPELSSLGKEQMVHLGHTVITAGTIADAEEIWEQNNGDFHLVITDHRLPDGRGIDFVVGLKDLAPKVKSTVVSGCLTLTDRQMLRIHNIPYFEKPVLYSHVLNELRKPKVVPTPTSEAQAKHPNPVMPTIPKPPPQAQPATSPDGKLRLRRKDTNADEEIENVLLRTKEREEELRARKEAEEAEARKKSGFSKLLRRFRSKD